MRALSDTNYWDTVHHHAGGGHGGRLAGWAKHKLIQVLGPERLSYFRNYSDYVLWDGIYPDVLRLRPGAKLLEVGSAPGEHLLALARRFGIDPYGVDYSVEGVEINRANFEKAGFDPENVMLADFLAPEFHDANRGRFDVVMSRGFIEHFSEPERLVEKHVELLAPGGQLVISVPNLRGVNRALAWLLDRNVLAIHNLSIMRRSGFNGLFQRHDLSREYCDFYGTFDLTMQNARPGSVGARLLAGLARVQPALNALFRASFDKRGFDSGFWSPQILFVGTKQAIH